MAKIAYFDCFSGISGDMCLGALVDAGVPLNDIEKELRKLPVKGYRLSEKKVKKTGFAATKVDVILTHDKRSSRTEVSRWDDISGLITTSSLSGEIKQKGLSIFKTLFEAEAKVHQSEFNKIHLHELGGIDCLIDILGTVAGLSMMGITKVYSSAVNLGGGTVQTEHGNLPVPAPATAEILRGVPVYSSGIPFELTTPTGAAILKTLSSGFGIMPCFIPDKIGSGAGNMDLPKTANILRIMTGDITDNICDEKVAVIETNIDDMNPQIYEYVMERLFKNGALDVFLTQIIMKKNRPAVKLSVICEPHKKNELIGIIMAETTTIGVRSYEADRVTMKREIETVKTEYGNIRMKYSKFGASSSKAYPEYEDCKKIAKARGIPLLSVIRQAGKAVRKNIK